jgi:hypothetical protein
VKEILTEYNKVLKLIVGTQRNKMKDKNFTIDYECRSCGTLIKDFNSLVNHINNGHEHEIRYLGKIETSKS